MRVRVTYAFNRDNICTEILDIKEATDLLRAHEEVVSYLEETIGANSVLGLVALSILIIDQEECTINVDPN